MIVPQTVLWETFYLADIELGYEKYTGEYLPAFKSILWPV